MLVKIPPKKILVYFDTVATVCAITMRQRIYTFLINFLEDSHCEKYRNFLSFPDVEITVFYVVSLTA